MDNTIAHHLLTSAHSIQHDRLLVLVTRTHCCLMLNLQPHTTLTSDSS